MTQTLKKLMAVALVFAMTAVQAPRKVTMAEAHQALAPYFTVRFDKGVTGGLKGVSGLATMIALNSMVARGVAPKTIGTNIADGAEALVDGAKALDPRKIPAVLADAVSAVKNIKPSIPKIADLRLKVSAAVSAVKSFRSSIPSVADLKSKGAAVASAVFAPVEFVGGVFADMNPVGEYSYDNSKERDAALKAPEDSVAAVETFTASVERTAEQQRQEAIDAAKAGVSVPAHVNKKYSHIRGYFGKSVKGSTVSPATIALANKEQVAADAGRSLMAYMTIASAIYTAYNSYVAFKEARAAKTAQK
jgi:hypothetical protein